MSDPANLESMGITVQRSFTAGSADTSGITTSESTQLAFTLPKPSSLLATFSKEGLGKKLTKLFKKELQTGDSAFDVTVYVSTDTPEATARFLESKVVRSIVTRIVGSGGSVEVDGAFVKLELTGHHESDDDDTVTLVRALIAGG